MMDVIPVVTTTADDEETRGVFDVRVFDTQDDADLYTHDVGDGEDDSSFVTFVDMSYKDVMQLTGLAIKNGKVVHIIPVEE